MGDNNISVKQYIIYSVMNDLITGGRDSSVLNVPVSLSPKNSTIEAIKRLIDDIRDYFYKSKYPTREFLLCYGLELREIEQYPIELAIRMDSCGFLIFDSKLSCQVVDTLNSAVALYHVGMRNHADKLTRVGVELLLNDFFEEIISNHEKDKKIKDALSLSQKEKARKPRNNYYNEVMHVIKLTWEKYPKASKTGLLNELSVYYHGKVSKNTLDKWIKESGAQPPRPDKYSSFELVHPQ